MFSALFKKTTLPNKEDCLPGREEKMPVYNRHEVLGTLLDDDFTGMQRLMVGMGCFWGAERKFWTLEGVVSTAVGYASGHTPIPLTKRSVRAKLVITKWCALFMTQLK